jgi:hypothetical protein
LVNFEDCDECASLELRLSSEIYVSDALKESPNPFVFCESAKIETKKRYKMPPPTRRTRNVTNVLTVYNRIGQRLISAVNAVVELPETTIPETIVAFSRKHPPPLELVDFVYRNSYIEVAPSEHHIVSYLFSGIEWNCSYSIFSIDDRMAAIIANANIRNHTDTEIRVDRLDIVVGQPKEPEPHYEETTSMRAVPGVMMARAESVREPNVPPSSEFSEYIRYQIDEPVDVQKGLSIVRLFYVPEPQEQRKIYLYDILPDRIDFGFEFTTDRYLPEGSAVVYDGEMRFVGSPNIPDTVAGKNVKILLGKPNDLECERQMQTKQLPVREIPNIPNIEEYYESLQLGYVFILETTTIDLTVRNSSRRERTIIVTFPEPDGYYQFDPHPSRKEKGQLEWDILSREEVGQFRIVLYVYKLIPPYHSEQRRGFPHID